MLRIVNRLRAHEDLAGRPDLVLSAPDIGERTALALVVRMPEFGRISREKAAALAPTMTTAESTKASATSLADEGACGGSCTPRLSQPPSDGTKR